MSSGDRAFSRGLEILTAGLWVGFEVAYLAGLWGRCGLVERSAMGIWPQFYLAGVRFDKAGDRRWLIQGCVDLNTTALERLSTGGRALTGRLAMADQGSLPVQSSHWEGRGRCAGRFEPRAPRMWQARGQIASHRRCGGGSGRRRLPIFWFDVGECRSRT